MGKVFRHLQAYRMGEQYDPDDGHEHLAAVIADCMVLMEYEQFGPVPCKDDRRNAYSDALAASMRGASDE
jgi:hypothetical protein